MRHLKLLKLNYVEFSGSLDYLPSELGYLCWHGYPFKSLPPRFLPYKLVSLSLANSKIKQLWEDTKPLHNLKRLDLSSSEDLIKVPDLGEAINLEWLSLKSCTTIREIHPSIGLLRKLSYVTLEGCKGLIKLPHFEETQNLEILDLERCIKLEKIHPSIGLIRKLKFLNLKNCESLTMLPHFREDLNLEILNLEGCRKLGQINPSIHHLKKLTVLNLKGCKRLVSLPNSILCLNSLSYLNLSSCSNLSYIQLLEKPRDEGHSKRPCIGEASVRSSIMKRWFKSPLHLFNSRTHKHSFSHLLPSPNFSCIRELDLSFCALLQIPDVIGKLHSLERLNLSGNSFCKLPNLKELSKLYRLVLRHCRQLKYLPELPSQTHLPSVIYERPWPTTESPVWANAPQKPLLHVINSGLEVLNCPELVEIERERCTRMTVSWMIQILQAQRRIDPLSIPMNPLFSSVIPGSEIPRLFNHQEYSTLTRIDESPFGHDYVAAVFCVIFEARFKRGIVSSICPPKAKGKFSDSKISMVFDSDLAIADYVSDYLWIFFLNKYEFIKYQYTPLYDEIVDLVGNDHYDIDVKKCGYRLIYDLDLELSNLAMMHGGNSPALNNDLSAIEDNK
ncbi:hypothetical protein V8G54_024518 [Vigna mungo]|uniref:Uncharacterized protein n=1 Tax=Vigna mungo TaxID=3915 RepID=A0AAQ3N739_VIGMU